MDAPGTLHHVMVRGIEKRRIFENDRDREDFLHRLGALVAECGASCFAWVLIPNHAHLLLRTGSYPLAGLMGRLLTGYALRFNRRHGRSGHLFQNRYRSIVCEQDSYLLELVRYIYLNGIRTGLIKDMEQLDGYPWSGHSAIVGRQSRPWQAREEVLSYFGKQEASAKKAYRQFISEGIGVGVGEELKLAVRGKDGRETDGNLWHDPRILGCDRFVEKTLAQMEHAGREREVVRRRPVDLEGLIEFIAKQFGVNSEEIRGGSRRRATSEARSVYCHVCVSELGVTGKRRGSEDESRRSLFFLKTG